jgi:hypothetical protein
MGFARTTALQRYLIIAILVPGLTEIVWFDIGLRGMKNGM